MKQANLNVEKREGTGRGACRRLRAANKIPAVVYGKSGAHNLSINESDLRSLMRDIHGSASLVTLAEGSDGTRCVLKDLSRDPLTDKFIHVDFLEVDMNEEMAISLPVHITGESFGVKNENGTIEVQLYEIDIRCLPSNMPEYIEVDVTELHAGDSIHISDLKAIEGVTFENDAESSVVICSTQDARAVAEADAEDAKAEAAAAAAAV